MDSAMVPRSFDYFTPSSMFHMNPAWNMLGDMNSMFDDWFTLPQDREVHRRRPNRFEEWTHKIDLSGYQPKDITVKNEEGKVLVTAHHRDGDDFMDLRRSVVIPEDVDRERVRCNLTRDHELVIHGPRKISSALTRPRAVDPVTQMLRNTRVVKCEKTGQEKFQVDIPCADFKPEELKLRQEGNRVVVEGEHKTDAEYKQLRREFTLPTGSDLETVVCSVDEKGTLRVETPYQRVEEAKPKEITIGKSDSEHKMVEAATTEAMEQ